MNDEDRLWELIEEGKSHSVGNLSKQILFLKAQLLQFEAENLFALCIASERILQKGYTHQMIGAGEIINGYCQEEELDYFLARLMANGRESYHKALKMPDEHLSKTISFDVYPLSYKSEDFRNVFWDTYYEKLGKKAGEDEKLDESIYEEITGDLDENGVSIFERLHPIPPTDPAADFPRLYYLQRKRKSSKTYTYKTFWGNGYMEKGVIQEGELWELFVDTPYAFLNLGEYSREISLIPSFEYVQRHFLKGGGDGGMGPGNTWNPISITKKDYDQMVEVLLSLDLEASKEKHFYLPQKIVLDQTLNERYTDADEWLKQWWLKYRGIGRMDHFAMGKYPVRLGGMEIGHLSVHAIGRSFRANWKESPGEENVLILEPSSPPRSGAHPLPIQNPKKPEPWFAVNPTQLMELQTTDRFGRELGFTSMYFFRNRGRQMVQFEPVYKEIPPSFSGNLEELGGMTNM